MKKNLWLLCSLMISSGLLAQPAPNAPGTPIETPAAAPMATVPGSGPATDALGASTASGTHAAAAKGAKKKSGKKKSPKAEGKRAIVKKPTHHVESALAELKSIPLVPGPATVIASHVNVRGQGRLVGEVIGHLGPGDNVNVLEEITLKHSGPDEPSTWAKISLPPTIHAWVNASFVDAGKAVTAKRLNLRGGPGENFSVLGRIERGETVKEVSTKGDWMEIEAPANAYAFVAAVYLKQGEPAPVAPAPATTPTPAVEIPAPAAPIATTAPTTTPAPPPVIIPAPTPVPTTTTAPEPAAPVAAAPVVATPPPAEPAPEPAKPVEPPPAAPVAATPTPVAPAAALPEPKSDEPLPPRVVQREGTVRGMTSIQAPSFFALISVDTGKNIDYLYTTSTNLHLDKFKGAHVVVVGEEFLDERWGNTPVIEIQKLIVVKDGGF
jgi:hypothetical protein